mgnify:CR=1 FL=1
MLKIDIVSILVNLEAPMKQPFKEFFHGTQIERR